MTRIAGGWDIDVPCLSRDVSGSGQFRRLHVETRVVLAGVRVGIQKHAALSVCILTRGTWKLQVDVAISSGIVALTDERNRFDHVHHAVVFVQQDMTVVDVPPDVVGEAKPKNDASPVAGNPNGVHPSRFVQYVDEISVFVRDLDPHHPEGILMDMERMVDRTADDLEVVVPVE